MRITIGALLCGHAIALECSGKVCVEDQTDLMQVKTVINHREDKNHRVSHVIEEEDDANTEMLPFRRRRRKPRKNKKTNNKTTTAQTNKTNENKSQVYNEKFYQRSSVLACSLTYKDTDSWVASAYKTMFGRTKKKDVKQELSALGWERKQKIVAKNQNISLFGGLAEDVVEFYQHFKDGAVDMCMISFRGADSPTDFKHVANPREANLHHLKVGAGIKIEFEGIIEKLKEGTDAYADLQDCPNSEVIVTGYSLGGALAGLTCALFNHKDDPLGAKLTCSKLYEYGGLPISNPALTNDKSKDGCFAGTRFVTVKKGGWGCSSKKKCTDWATWVGAPRPPKPLNRLRMPTFRGTLRHPKVASMEVDVTNKVVKQGDSCTVAPRYPAFKRGSKALPGLIHGITSSYAAYVGK